MKIGITELEAKLGYKIKKNTQSIGLDIAERTGVCVVTTDDKIAEFDWYYVEFDKSNIATVYKEMYREFLHIIQENKNKDNIVIIEDTFLMQFGKFVQADVFKKLTRFGTLALAVCFDRDIKYEFILAKTSRARLKIKMITGKPKESVAKYLKETFNIELDDNDISDSVVLSMLGICEGMDFKPLPKKKKIKMVQYINTSGDYTKINKKSKEILGVKKSKGPYKGIDIIDRPWQMIKRYAILIEKEENEKSYHFSRKYRVR